MIQILHLSDTGFKITMINKTKKMEKMMYKTDAKMDNFNKES